MRELLHHLRLLLGAALCLLLASRVADREGWRWQLPGRKDKGYEILEIFREEARLPDVVFLGSSQTRWGLLPRIAEALLRTSLGRPVEVWNLGLNGGLAPELDTLLPWVSASGKDPRVLVVEASPAYWNEARRDAAVLTYWRDFAGFGESWAGICSRPWVQTREGLAAPLRGARALWQQGVRLWDPVLVEGWRAARARSRATRGAYWTDLDLRRDAQRSGRVNEVLWRAALARREERVPLLRPLRSGARWAPVLARLIAHCRASRTRLVLWNPPLRPELASAYEPGAAERHLAWIEEAVRSTDGVLLDLSQPSLFARKDFFNLDHLAPLGAEKATRMLVEQALLPLLRKGR